jgi:tripartite ATP-independent transporter DctP family solute receptor
MSGIQNLLLAVLLCTCALTGFLQLSNAVDQDRVIIRIGHDSKESSPVHQAMLLFEQEVEANSDGKVQVQIYPARQLGDVRETTEMVQQGNLQMTFGASVLLTSIVPEFNVLDLFYLFRDLEHAHRALDHEDVGQVLLQAMEDKGFHGLGFMEVGFRSLTSNERPVQQFEDLQGLKIRANSNPAQIQAWEAVNTLPTPLSWGEIFTSLQQGLINSQECSTYSIFAERFYEAQRYLSLSEHTYTNYTWFANKAFWEGLSAAHQQLVSEAARKTIDHQRQLAGEQNRSIVEELQRQGMSVNVVAAPVRAQMKEAMNGAVFAMLRERTGAELFDDIVANINAL